MRDPKVNPTEMVLYQMIIEKRPGADWSVYYMDTDGSRHCMTIFGSPDAGDAYKEALNSFNFFPSKEGRETEVEIVAIVRREVDLALYWQ